MDSGEILIHEDASMEQQKYQFVRGATNSVTSVKSFQNDFLSSEDGNSTLKWEHGHPECNLHNFLANSDALQKPKRQSEQPDCSYANIR